MNYLNKVLTLIMVLSISTISLYADVKLPSIFGSHMVLQQNHRNPIWGTAKKSEKISISIANQTHKAIADKNGKWQVKLDALKAGGPYQLIVKGNNTITFEDVLVGEVWLCTGQSNMAMKLQGNPGQHIEGSQETIMNSSNSQIRFITIERAVSETPLTECKGNWTQCNPETVGNFSAVGYHFGSLLQKQLGVPIGLISSNVGGTPAQAWTPNNIIETEFHEFKTDMQKEYTQKTATALYNGMINPLIPYGIKGTIWYQGEGNRWDPEQYSRLFPSMIKSWRDNWAQGDFPFYFVQIAPYGYNVKGWVGVQQAQLKTMLTFENTGMACINDLGAQKCIHPPRKKEVGQRLAFWALSKTYDKDYIIPSGPIYKSMEVTEGKAMLSFNHAPIGITSMGKPLSNFEVAGADGVFHPAQAKIVKRGTVLQVWSKDVSKPTSVRYGWNSYFEGSLYNTAGLPASSFCTDDWDTIFKMEN
ncbi:sialate O-acetylesterase [Saccharicrinis aurantiacus]|uniref:sialate O-acetylesterase n=1 Tax=Saccharicrinis aurantiacus TaxID=1849719 RepID=UPI00248FF560|nr:sialate O-acetylesterase [Saccharicrinis aurantiacus]